jgi:hypothetical protein
MKYVDNDNLIKKLATAFGALQNFQSKQRKLNV